jgi:hypothetical protein
VDLHRRRSLAGDRLRIEVDTGHGDDRRAGLAQREGTASDTVGRVDDHRAGAVGAGVACYPWSSWETSKSAAWSECGWGLSEGLDAAFLTLRNGGGGQHG